MEEINQSATLNENESAQATFEEVAEEQTVVADDAEAQAVSDEVSEAQAEQPEQAADDQDAPKKKIRVPAGLQKLWNWIKAHENIRQMVFFIGFSLICFAVEYITFTIINESCKLAGGDAVRPFHWFLFDYDSSSAGVGGFAAFLVSNIIAQICTFVLNRKKTFKATNNVVISGIMYAILVVIIILLNTYLGGVITKAIAATSPDNATIATVGGYVGKFTGSFLSFVINFVGCKFLVMRNWGKKQPAADSEAVTDNASDSADADLETVTDNPSDTNNADLEAVTDKATTETVADDASELDNTDSDSIANDSAATTAEAAASLAAADSDK